MKLNNGVVPEGVSKDQVWDAKYVYESAYHPSTGELTFLPGRMSFQGKTLNHIKKYLKVF